ncbi:hypothetical protein V6N11_039319 [Hibiscus sabdariffa]|uniref:Trichome birefringence-like C-terminal domain-containing protein n=1 Tax=Hibiscus sabdariffa TaxID=183260 RepID=A0ABR2SNA2_9ROSI
MSFCRARVWQLWLMEEEIGVIKNGDASLKTVKFQGLFNVHEVLGKLRGKRIVFVEDSLSRTQWESMICMLMQGVLDKRRDVYEINGNKVTKRIGFLGVWFSSYNLRIDYYRGRNRNSCKVTKGKDRSRISNIIMDVVKKMTAPVTVLHVTPMGAFCSDAHVGTWSNNRSLADCSHWCLHGMKFSYR